MSLTYESAIDVTGTGRYQIDLRPLAFVACYTLFLIAANVDLSFIVAKVGHDSQHILNSLTEDPDTSGVGFYDTFLFFKFFGPLAMFPVYFAGLVTLITLMYGQRHWFFVLIASGMFLPVLIFECRPSKETVVSYFVVIVLAAILAPIKRRWQVLTIFVLYGLYAALFRSYYAIIIVAWLWIMLFAHLSPGRRALLVAVTVLAVFAAPSSVVTTIGQIRDLSSKYHMARGETASAFLNPFGDQGAIGFWLNYIYAALRLNVPVLFAHRAKEFVLFFYAVTTLTLVIPAVLQKHSLTVRMLAALALAHLAVLWLFEGDLGSYFRHMSTTFAYLGVIIAYWQDQTIGKIRTQEDYSLVTAS